MSEETPEGTAPETTQGISPACQGDQEKSILDHVQIKDEAFPLSKPAPAEEAKSVSDPEPAAKPQRWLSLVGNCPRCGGPVYGPTSVVGNDDPTVLAYCICLSPGQTNSSEGEDMAAKKTAAKKAVATAPKATAPKAAKTGKKGKK